MEPLVLQEKEYPVKQARIEHLQEQIELLGEENEVRELHRFAH